MLSKILKKKKKNDESNEVTTNTAKTPEQLFFDPDSVKRTAQLSPSDFGAVYKGDCAYDNEIQTVFISEVALKSGFESELSLFASLQHPLILPLVGYWEDSFYRKKYILSSFCEKETMDIYLRGYQQNRKEYADMHHHRKLTAWAIDIATAMKYLHSNKVIHGGLVKEDCCLILNSDLAAHNILMVLSPDCSMKLTNFGLWKIVESSSIASKSRKWSAPEVREESHYSTKSDVWSFGVVLWQIFSWGAEPYAELQMNEKNDKSLPLLAQPADCPEEIYKLMLECWKTNPDDRPYFDEIIESLSRMQKDMKTVLRPNQSNLLPGLTALKMTLPKQLGSEEDFTQLGWYGRIGRAEAEKILQRTPVGTYLTRWSENEKMYVLSFKSSEGFSHVSGLVATEDAFLVNSTKGELKFNKAVHYLQYMKTTAAGITQSIHEISLRKMSRPVSGIYVNDDNDTGLYVTNQTSTTNASTIYSEINSNNKNEDFPSVYIVD